MPDQLSGSFSVRPPPAVGTRRLVPLPGYIFLAFPCFVFGTCPTRKSLFRVFVFHVEPHLHPVDGSTGCPTLFFSSSYSSSSFHPFFSSCSPFGLPLKGREDRRLCCTAADVLAHHQRNEHSNLLLLLLFFCLPSFY